MWNHASSDRSDSTLQFSYNRYERDDIFDETRGTFDLNFQNHIAVRTRHDIVWGAEAETSGSRTRGSLFVSFDPANIRTELFGAFVQDEIALASGRVHLALGAKLEHNHYSSFNVMPTARLAWALNERNTLWTAISRGVRTPAETDASVRVNLMGVSGPGGAPALVSLIGNPQVKDENLLGVEAGYRTTIRARLSADLALYYDNYTSQETQEPSTTFLENTPAPAHLVFPETFENLMNGEAHGFEIFAKWKVANRWTVSPGYAFEQVHMHLLPGSQDTSAVSEAQGSAPVHSAQLRSHVALPDRFSWDTSAYFTGRIADPAVPSYTRLDMILSWQPQERLFFSVVGQNLLKDRHLEYADATDSVVSTLMKRSVYAKLTWTF